MRVYKKILAIFLASVMTFGTCVVSQAEELEIIEEPLVTEVDETESTIAIDEADAIDCDEVTEETTEEITENMDDEGMNEEETEELDELEINASIADHFVVPYISTYYFNPKPLTTDNIQIPLYITDNEQSEYLKNDTTKRLDLIYKVDGVAKTIKDLPLGDYTLTIGKLSEGEHTFSVQVLDKKTGMKSHELFNDLWVVKSYDIPANKTYTMTNADLVNYKIKNNNSTNASDLVNTRDGLTKLFADKQAEGYEKIILLKGTYRINGEIPNGSYNSDYTKYSIKIPSHFTVDMNGCTFKLDTITNTDPKVNAEIVTMDGVVDAHLTNGILEGDRVEKQALGMETTAANKAAIGEHIGTIYMRGARYCSLSDLTVKQTAGFTFYNNYSQGPTVLVNSYTKTAIFDGEEVQAPNCSTSSFMDITQIAEWEGNKGYIIVGHFAGYRGIQGDSPIVYVSFYDANKNYIETVTGYQFRKIKTPANAKYARITMLGDISVTNIETNIYIYNKCYGNYSEIKNNEFYDTRTCAIATATCENLLVEGNKYIRCGNSITPLAVDFEDGAQEMQDIYYRNNEVVEKGPTSTGTVVSCFGFNHVFENNINHDITIRSSVLGGVFRNCTDGASTVTWLLGDKKSSAYARVYNNDCGKITLADSRTRNYDFATIKVKNSTVRATWTEGVEDHFIYENCTLPILNGGFATFNNCKIQSVGTITSGAKFYDCIFLPKDGATEYTLKFSNLTSAKHIFDHCDFQGKLKTDHYFKSAVFTNCNFDDLTMVIPPCPTLNTESLYFENCIINSTGYTFAEVGPAFLGEGYVNCTFKNCDMTLGTKLFNVTGTVKEGSQILFDGCSVNRTIETNDYVKVIDKEVSKKNGLLTENGKIYYYIDDVKQTGWQTVGGKKYYFGTDYAAKTGLQTISSKVYYFDTNGVMQTGLKTVSSKVYYFGTDGAAKTGWQTVSNNKYYFGTDGVAKTGLQTISSKKYYFNTSGVMQTGWQTISSKKYYFGSDGAMLTGWQTVGGKRYYLGTDGAMLIGWQTISSKRYYLGTDGAMLTGWQTIDNKKYYLGTDGVMVTGTVVIDGKTYQFDSYGVFVKEVVKKNGLLTESGKIYYYIDDVKQTGWQTVDSKKYYFGTDYAAKTGLQTISSKVYYFDTNGVMQTGLKTVSSKVYYFGSDGIAKTGWQTVSNNKYYFGTDGVAKTGLQTISSKKYYFNTSGVMQTGWQTISSKKYYLGTDGAMLTGWQTIDSKKYYLGTDGVMVTGTVTIDGKTYEFDANGVFIKEVVEEVPEQPEKKNGFVEEAGKTYYYVDDVKQLGWKKIDSVWYYFGADGVMATKKWVSYSGDWYYFNADGTMATNKWVAYGGEWYYFGANGVMATDKWIAYDGDWYYFDADGIMVTNKWVAYKGSWYYFGTNGTMTTSKWVSYKGDWYFVGDDGVMATSKWIQYKNDWYYFNASGIMVTGKQVINGKTYNFNSSGVWIN